MVVKEEEMDREEDIEVNKEEQEDVEGESRGKVEEEEERQWAARKELGTEVEEEVGKEGELERVQGVAELMDSREKEMEMKVAVKQENMVKWGEEPVA